MHRLLLLAGVIALVLVFLTGPPVAMAMSPPSAATQVNVAICAPSGADHNIAFGGNDAVASNPVAMTDPAGPTATDTYYNASTILANRAAPANERTEGQSASAIGATTTQNWRRDPWA